jgi:hypothetical protein
VSGVQRTNEGMTREQETERREAIVRLVIGRRKERLSQSAVHQLIVLLFSLSLSLSGRQERRHRVLFMLYCEDIPRDETRDD